MAVANFALLAIALFAVGCAEVPLRNSEPVFADTTWQLVKFQGGDGQVIAASDATRYTVAFASDGGVSVRFDCNRGRGTWKSAGPGRLEFGQLALTRAMCPPGSLHDLLAKHWSYVRSFLLRDGRLYLSLMADGGTYEFEPALPLGSKISLELSGIDRDGLRGPPGGLRAVHYEYCIPDGERYSREVRGIDPTAQLMPGSPGRIGCAGGQVLALGNTRQPAWREVLERLAALPWVARIAQSHFE